GTTFRYPRQLTEPYSAHFIITTLMPAPIEFYFDFISPYGYFGSEKIAGIASRFERRVDWKPVLLGITVLKVMGLKPLMDTPLKSDYIRHDKQRMAKLLDVPFREHNLTGVN